MYARSAYMPIRMAGAGVFNMRLAQEEGVTHIAADAADAAAVVPTYDLSCPVHIDAHFTKIVRSTQCAQIGR